MSELCPESDGPFPPPVQDDLELKIRTMLRGQLSDSPAPDQARAAPATPAPPGCLSESLPQHRRRPRLPLSHPAAQILAYEQEQIEIHESRQKRASELRQIKARPEETTKHPPEPRRPSPPRR